MKILVIEDDREAARYLEKAFAEAGHSADIAGDGETGYTLAEQGTYDALVVDRMLPRRDGLSVVAALRAQGNDTPALILSALGQVDDRVTGLQGRRRRLPYQALCVLRAAWPASRSCKGDRARKRRKRSIASAISNSTACRIPPNGQVRSSSSSRANSVCSNI